MKKRVVAALAGLLMVLAVIYLSAGYSGSLTQDVSYYTRHDDVVSGTSISPDPMRSGEAVSVVGCFDSKTDIYFELADSSGRTVFVDTLPIAAARDIFPTSTKQVVGFFAHPIASMNCWSLVPRAVQMAEERGRSK